jgi:hypothetical protein
VDILIRAADCYRETGDLDTAVVFYVNGKLKSQKRNIRILSLTL